MSSTDDALVESPTTRVMGLGVGIFLIAFFTITVILMFAITTPCAVRPKLVCRTCSILWWVIILLIMLYAPRENTYVSTEGELKEYDTSVIPRVSIMIGMIFCAVFAAFQFMKQHLMESRKHLKYFLFSMGSSPFSCSKRIEIM